MGAGGGRAGERPVLLVRLRSDDDVDEEEECSDAFRCAVSVAACFRRVVAVVVVVVVVDVGAEVEIDVEISAAATDVVVAVVVELETA